ncbi:MAG: methyltransferase regulatory domain-containing protein [Myxococcota bacterium]
MIEPIHEPPPEPDDSAARYDEVPYDSRTVALSHPDHLAVLARLHGLTPPPIARCRVLELGCASAMNLLPMALELRESRFVGVDVGARQIRDGRRAVAELGLDNVELHARDLATLRPGELGQADFILCHGVWSWVPEAVRSAILAVIRDHLAPHGVAFLSFNTLPGWHALATVRDSLVRLVPADLPAGRRVAQARRLLAVLGAALGERETPLDATLRSELQRAGNASDAYLLHEYLAPINRGEFFGDVVRRAADAGLGYVAHAIPDTMLAHLFAPEVAAEVEAEADPIAQQEMLDVAQWRRFTSLVLARADAPVRRALTPEVLAELFVSASFDAAPEGFPAITSASGLSSPGLSPPTDAAPPCREARGAAAVRSAWPRACRASRPRPGDGRLRALRGRRGPRPHTRSPPPSRTCRSGRARAASRAGCWRAASPGSPVSSIVRWCRARPSGRSWRGSTARRRWPS